MPWHAPGISKRSSDVFSFLLCIPWSPQIMEKFPPIFRAKILRHLYRPVLEGSYLLASVTDAFIDVLSCELAIEIFQEGISVVAQDDSAQELFFIVSGSFECTLLKSHLDPGEAGGDEAAGGLDAGDNLFVGKRGDNELLGEIPFLFDLLQPFSCSTDEVSRVLILTKAAWKRITAADQGHNKVTVENLAFRELMVVARAAKRAGSGLDAEIGTMYDEMLVRVQVVRDNRTLVRASKHHPPQAPLLVGGGLALRTNRAERLWDGANTPCAAAAAAHRLRATSMPLPTPPPQWQSTVAGLCSAAESSDLPTMKRLLLSGHGVEWCPRACVVSSFCAKAFASSRS